MTNDSGGPNDYTPLHFAATYGHLELARVLLAHGADVDDATPGETPLDRAVIMHDVPMATLLLEHGANADHPSAGGLSALHRAAIRGHTEIVRLLLAHRANPLARDGPGTLRWLGQLAQESSIDSRLGDPLRRRKAA
jgi:ankyrin repeat protein